VLSWAARLQCLTGWQLLSAALRRDVRTSQGTFVSRDEDPDGVLAWVEEKTAQITGIPSGHGEVRAIAAATAMHPTQASGGSVLTKQTPCVQPFNVLRYENGQHYDAHYDVFDPESYGPQTSQRVRR
jgi:prolyl 4-hydroxylase